MPKIQRGKMLAGGLVSLCAGIILLAHAFTTGQASFYFVLVFPVVTSTGFTGVLGSILLFIGITTISLGILSLSYGGEGREGSSDGAGAIKKESSFGGVVLIGPIPIIFGSDKKTTVLAALATIIILLALVLFVLKFI